MFIHNPQLIRNIVKEDSAISNAGVVTVLAAGTLVTQLPSLDLISGERLLIEFNCRMLKGGVAGESRYLVYRTAGTAVVQWSDTNFTATAYYLYIPIHSANQIWQTGGFVQGIVTTSGTLTLGLGAFSIGSNGTIDPNLGKLSVTHLR